MANIPEFISVLRKIRDVIYPKVEVIYENTATLKNQAEKSKIAAAASAIESASSAATATTRANEIKNVSAQASTLSSGSLATVSYNSTDGKFTFGLPVGAKGDKGENYTINASGTTAGRAAYDTQLIGFSYLDISLSIVYFKLSATSGDWSTGTSFGKGENGASGVDGTGITSIAFYSTTSDNGLSSQQGATDTYRITLSNSTTYDLAVKNGSDSDDTVLVHKSGAETLNDVKTFISSPIVPTPTTGEQAVNKYYADLKVALTSFTGANVSLNGNGYQKLPSGLIIQWGDVNVIATNGGYVAASYPVRFPNNCFQAIGARDALGENAIMLVGKAVGDPAGQVIVQNWGPSAEIAKYIAIGY